MRPYSYAFVKIDVPYMPKDFPENIPVGKDADIICSKNDFCKLWDIVKDWSVKLLSDISSVSSVDSLIGVKDSSLRGEYYVKSIEEQYGNRLRIYTLKNTSILPSLLRFLKFGTIKQSKLSDS